MSRITLREWPCICTCGFNGKVRGWSNEMPFQCPDCGEDVDLYQEPKGKAPGIASDTLLNYEAKHGVCWPDGTPRRFDSKTELKRALNKAGLKIVGDTPGQDYRVPWDGKRERRPDEICDKSFENK